LKSEIRNPKSETNSNYTKLNVQNGSLPKACRDSGRLALSTCGLATYDMQTEMSTIAYWQFMFAFWQTYG